MREETFEFILYKPTSILEFGRYKGETISFVYKYDPRYLEWLITYRKYFMIILSDFKHITSTPYYLNGIDAVNGKVAFNGTNIPLSKYVNEHTKKPKGYIITHTLGSCYLSKKTVCKLNYIERLVDYWYIIKELRKYEKLIKFTIDMNRFDERMYQKDLCNEISENAYRASILNKTIDDFNKDYYDEFDGFYHEDME